MSALKSFSDFGVLEAIIWHYVGANLSALFHAYLAGEDTYYNVDWQYIANICAAFYEPGLLWLRTAPVRVDWTEALCFAVKNGNYPTAKRYRNWIDDNGSVEYTRGLTFYYPGAHMLVGQNNKHNSHEYEKIHTHALFIIAAIDSGRIETYDEILRDNTYKWPVYMIESYYINMHLAAHGSIAGACNLNTWKDVLCLAVLWGSVEAATYVVANVGSTTIAEDDPTNYYSVWFRSDNDDCSSERSIQMLELLHNCFARRFNLKYFLMQCNVPSISPELAMKAAIASVRKCVLHIEDTQKAYDFMTDDYPPQALLSWCDNVIPNYDCFWAELGLE
jgi:hypothetical protein